MDPNTFANVEVRTPVIAHEQAEALPPDTMKRQWALFCELARRELHSDKTLQQLIAGLNGEQVDESLPLKFLQHLMQHNVRSQQLAKRYERSLGTFLHFPSVPPEELKPDVSNALGLPSLDYDIRAFSQGYLADHPEEAERMIQHGIESGYYQHGVTHEERELVKLRYMFARDVKVLALMAEMMIEKPELDAAGHASLQSGIKIEIDPQSPLKDELMQPDTWIARTQLKDRVYVGQIDDGKLILKERKTAFHTSTMKHGHKNGLPSEYEFLMAKKLNAEGNYSDEDVQISWEKAIGYVEFPDGFQFAIFEYEPDLLDRAQAQASLTSVIEANMETFQSEYIDACIAIEKNPIKKTVMSRMSKDFLSKQSSLLTLSFHDFAVAKAYFIKKTADSLVDDIRLNLHITNRDMDRPMYRVHPGQTPLLELVNMDYEYYQEETPERIAEILRNTDHFQKSIVWPKGIGFLEWDDGTPVTKAQDTVFIYLTNKRKVKQFSNKP